MNRSTKQQPRKNARTTELSCVFDMLGIPKPSDEPIASLVKQLRDQKTSSTDPDRLERMAREIEQ